MLADLKAIGFAKWSIKPLVGRQQMIILSARKRFGLWLRKTYAKVRGNHEYLWHGYIART